MEEGERLESPRLASSGDGDESSMEPPTTKRDTVKTFAWVEFSEKR
jgi:hypothetical protein